jgi:prepilin-type processing-associated H-X9-DG protein
MNDGLSSQDGWYGFGLLWKYGYVENGKVYYCPAADKKGGVGHNQAWPRAFDDDRNPADGKSRIFSTYVYRGGLSSQTGTSNGPLSINRNSGALATFADNPCSGNMWHEKKYNVAFLDGHIESFTFDNSVVPAGHLQDFWQAINAWEE